MLMYSTDITCTATFRKDGWMDVWGYKNDEDEVSLFVTGKQCFAFVCHHDHEMRVRYQHAHYQYTSWSYKLV